MRSTTLRIAGSLLTAAFAIGTHTGFAGADEAMNLADPRPRPVSVRFEASPSDQPGRLGSLYTAPLPARIEPGDIGGQMRVTIAGSDVETLWFRDQRVRPGSFSDFVWVFDVASGAVLSARLRGTVVRRFEFGLFTSDVETEIETEMTTQARAGFAPGRSRLGQLVFPLCLREGGGCTIVEPARYDPRNGYVNAVGALVCHALGTAVRSFSPLGEAIFSESATATGRRGDLADAR